MRWLGLALRKEICYLSQQHGVCILTTKPSCRMWCLWGLLPYHQPKQKMWNPTNHSYGPSTAYQTNHSLLFFSFKQLFSELISESLTILNSFCDRSWSPHCIFQLLTPADQLQLHQQFLHLSVPVDQLQLYQQQSLHLQATSTCTSAPASPAAVPAPASYQHLHTSST